MSRRKRLDNITSFEGFDMAIPHRPNDWDKLNFIRYAVFESCEAPLHIYVETFLPASLQLLINLACWDWDDLARWALRPHFLRGGAHTGDRKRKARRRRAPTWRSNRLPNLPAMNTFGATKYASEYGTLWIVDGVVQRAINYFVIYNAVKEFYYDWAAGIMRSEYCQTSASPAKASVFGSTESLPAIAGWVDLAINETNYLKGDITQQAFALFTGAGSFIVSATLKVDDFTDEEGQIRLRIQITQGGVTRYQYSEWRNVAEAKATGLLVFTKVVNGAAIRLEANLTHGFADTTQNLWVMRPPEGMPYPDRDTCATIPLDPYGQP